MLFSIFILIGLSIVSNVSAADAWVAYESGTGPGQGKHVVLIAGDDEYRSEETLPALAKILARHHGFRCTVLFAIDPKDGTINPDIKDNIPGLEALRSADLMVMCLRFRDLPDEQMQHIVDYVESGRPIIALRTSTHAFIPGANRKFVHYHSDYKEQPWVGGFGRRVLGETWVNHHGEHGKQGTRGNISPGQQHHPILRGIRNGDVFALSDVYEVRLPMNSDCQPLLLGEVTQTLDKNSPAVAGPKNNPMMPVAWTKPYATASGKIARVFTTTMGASQDLESAGLRRLLVNACYWDLQMESQIDPASSVELVGEYRPSKFAFHAFVKGIKPADLAWPAKSKDQRPQQSERPWPPSNSPRGAKSDG